MQLLSLAALQLTASHKNGIGFSYRNLEQLSHDGTGFFVYWDCYLGKKIVTR